ncbi:membrane protein [Arthrobacter phage Rizwana]|nr:membrane protein [Arthrobacter phage Rizwana]
MRNWNAEDLIWAVATAAGIAFGIYVLVNLFG